MNVTVAAADWSVVKLPPPDSASPADSVIVASFAAAVPVRVVPLRVRFDPTVRNFVALALSSQK